MVVATSWPLKRPQKRPPTTEFFSDFLGSKTTTLVGNDHRWSHCSQVAISDKQQQLQAKKNRFRVRASTNRIALRHTFWVVFLLFHHLFLPDPIFTYLKYACFLNCLHRFLSYPFFANIINYLILFGRFFNYNFLNWFIFNSEFIKSGHRSL